MIFVRRASGFVLGRRRSTIIAIERRSNLLIAHGQRGPRGLPGADGSSAASYTHTQSAPSALWTINHNLGFRPAIELIDVGGAEFDADIVHVTTNQARVYLTAPIVGTARCN